MLKALLITGMLLCASGTMVLLNYSEATVASDVAPVFVEEIPVPSQDTLPLATPQPVPVIVFDTPRETVAGAMTSASLASVVPDRAPALPVRSDADAPASEVPTQRPPVPNDLPVPKTEVPVVPVTTDPISTAAIATELARLRSDYGLPSLQPDARLNSLATERSRDMVRRNYFSHTSPDGCGLTCQFEQSGSGLGATRWAENIGWYEPYTSLSPRQLSLYFMEAWMESQGHRDNLLTPELTHYGVGTAKAGDRLIITMIFATLD